MRFTRSRETDRVEQLARKLEAAARMDEERKKEEQEIFRFRGRAAAELHATCAEFVNAVNGALNRPMLELSPNEFSHDSFQEEGSTVFQIGFSGRLIHVEFNATETLRSTERFRVPYILEGSVRAFNQELLDMAAVPEQLLFCCMEGEHLNWYWFDAGTQKAAPMDQNRLITLLERLL